MEDPAETGGAGARARDIDGAQCETVDLTGVDPARWPEIRRRVTILNDYVALRRPPQAVRRRFARRIGLSESQLMHLARVWRLGRDAARIPGAHSRTSVRKPRRIPARSVEIMRETIGELGSLARRKDVLAEVTRRCAAEDVAVPSDSTISNMLAEARSEIEHPNDLEPEILIDECSVTLPVATGGASAMPRLLIAITLPQRRIVATEISFDPLRAPAILNLMRSIAGVTDHSRAPVRLRAPHLSVEERMAIGAIGIEEGRGLPTLSRVMGGRLGGLRVIYQVSKARAGETLTAARHASTLNRHDATIAIGDAVASHNVKMAATSRRDPAATERRF